MLKVTIDVQWPDLKLSFKLGSGDGATARQAAFSLPAGKTACFLSLEGLGTLRSLELSASADAATGEGRNPLAKIESIEVARPFAGYRKTADTLYLSEGFGYAPGSDGSGAWTIAAPFIRPSEVPASSALVLAVEYAQPSDLYLSISSTRTRSLLCSNPSGKASIPLDLISDSSAASIRATAPKGLSLQGFFIEERPAESLLAGDPGILLMDRAIPSGQDFLALRWDLIPSIIILDFEDYATQDSYLKRLAFFVEKKGFTGSLATDEQISSLHGWNAHDYRSDDLARFFSLAESSSFPLNAEERTLRDFLSEKGLILKSGSGFKAGTGALLSISRESPDYLRRLFLTHESAHAVFFADEAYQRFCMDMWDSMEEGERRFWNAYFDWMKYDVKSGYLMANEMQAYLIQQPVRNAQAYFTETLADRLVANVPESASWVDGYMKRYEFGFTARAAALDAWLKNKYGIGAGRTFFLR